MSKPREYTVLFGFCGLGAGALGFLRAAVMVLGVACRFVSLGGVDIDPDACADFIRFTKSPAFCADIRKLTVADMIRMFGPVAPDVVFGSAPCKAASFLLGKLRSLAPEYQELNQLALIWIRLVLAAWPTPPRLILFENVPGITTRAAPMLRELKKMLRDAGYVLHDGNHDCGEVGGLGQHRRRWLLVARHASSVSTLLYKPAKKRVRGCGEILGELPLPGDPKAGPLHKLPKISWLNWVRLALIPPGGDWRDLPSGMTASSVHDHTYGVLAWDKAAHAITGKAGAVGTGPFSVADPRLTDWFGGTLGVLPWNAASGAVTGRASPTTGAFSVADPRLPANNANRHWNKYSVESWSDPVHSITGATRPGSGAPAIGDPRLTCEPRETSGAYGVLDWNKPAYSVTASGQIDNGRFAIADPRVPGNPQLAVRFYPTDPKGAPPFVPVLPTADGTWHRPMTTLELAVLQGLPAMLDGKPLTLTARTEAKRREHIGNAVPVGTAEAIARQMLLTLANADAGTFVLSGEGGGVWVDPEREAVMQ